MITQKPCSPTEKGTSWYLTGIMKKAREGLGHGVATDLRLGFEDQAREARPLQVGGCTVFRASNRPVGAGTCRECCCRHDCHLQTDNTFAPQHPRSYAHVWPHTQTIPGSNHEMVSHLTLLQLSHPRALVASGHAWLRVRPPGH